MAVEKKNVKTKEAAPRFEIRDSIYRTSASARGGVEYGTKSRPLLLLGVAALVLLLCGLGALAAPQWAVAALVLVELGQVVSEVFEDVGHGRPEVAELGDGPLAYEQVPQRQGRDAGLRGSTVSFSTLSLSAGLPTPEEGIRTSILLT